MKTLRENKSNSEPYWKAEDLTDYLQEQAIEAEKKFDPVEWHKKWLDEKEELEYTDIPMEVWASNSYWHEPDDATKTVYIDWTYKVSRGDIIEYVLDDVFPEEIFELPENEYDDWVEAHYDEYFEKYYDKIIDHYEDAAKEDADWSWDGDYGDDYE